MFSTVRLFIKTGIGFLFAGLAVGGYMLVERELFHKWPNPYLVSAHAHVVLVGFVMFLILGVALWLFPRAEKSDTRYKPRLITISYGVLCGATALRFLTEAARAWMDAQWLAWGVVIGGIGQIVGLTIYFWTMWSRIRSVGSRAREASGEKF
jgi:heme/copper-type cytochrome/quinol oxidase subunit 1